MARSRAQRNQPRPESKKALVIFLVFFILTTIGGGIFGYSGFEADAGKDSKIKGLEGQVKQAQDEAKYYKYQALVFRRFAGDEPKDANKKDYDDYNRQFVEKAETWTANPDRDTLEKLIKQTEAEIKRFLPEKLPADKQPGKDFVPFTDALRALKEQVTTAKADVKPFVKEKEESDTRAKDANVLREKAEADYKKGLKTAEDNVTELRNQLEAEKKRHETELAQQTAKTNEAIQKGADDKMNLEKALTVKDKEINGLKQRLEEVNADLAKVKPKDIEVPEASLRAVGRVTDRRGDTVSLDLGSLQKATPQLTFSVHAVGPDGSPVPASKGSVEVRAVYDAGSQARILLEKSKNDRIDRGDLLVNPNWNPDRQKHVAIAGIVDLSGEGRNQLRELRQLLERQNVVVDAYLEPADAQWVVQGKGITRQTNYLILGGDTPEGREQAEATKSLQKQIGEMTRQARENGVLIINLRNYLDMIGYQPRRGVGDSTAYRPPPPTAPEPEKKPPMPDKKEPVPPKDADGKPQ